jgi:hypothetical protein
LSSQSTATTPYRTCGCCGKQWTTWRDFVSDSELRLLGLQMVPNLPDGTLLVFDHCCGTSISLFARRLRSFLPQLDDELDPPDQLGYEECKDRCPELEDLLACDRACARARDRRLVQVILELRQE